MNYGFSFFFCLSLSFFRSAASMRCTALSGLGTVTLLVTSNRILSMGIRSSHVPWRGGVSKWFDAESERVELMSDSHHHHHRKQIHSILAIFHCFCVSFVRSTSIVSSTLRQRIEMMKMAKEMAKRWKKIIWRLMKQVFFLHCLQPADTLFRFQRD